MNRLRRGDRGGRVLWPFPMMLARRRRTTSFGWVYLTAPRWWPHSPNGPRALLLLEVIARFKLLFQPRIRNELCDNVQLKLGADWREQPNIHPMMSELTWVPDFGAFSTVAGLCGHGHETYVRILHTVRVTAEDSSERCVPWSALGNTPSLDAAWRPDRLPDGGIDYEWGQASDGVTLDLVEGRILDPEKILIGDILIDDLRQRGFAGRVIQAWWDGFGGSRLPEATQVRIDQPGRELVPFESEVPMFLQLAELENQTPALVFPDDGAWALANDIDLVSTYLGCSRELAQVFLENRELEVREVSADDRLG